MCLVDRCNACRTKEMEHKLVVVCIDFGNHYSGYCFGFWDDFKKDPWKLNMNDPWTTSGSRTHKTATCLLLDPDGKYNSFGYEAEGALSELIMDGVHREHYFFKNYKDAFFKDVDLHTKIRDSNCQKEVLLIDLIAMTLKYLKNHALDRIQKRFPDISLADIHWVLPVPTDWDEQHRQLYRDLAIESGLSHRRLKIILETEASLAYGMTYIRHRIPVEEKDDFASILSFPGAKVLLIDVGGDAAEATVHKMGGDKNMKITFKPMRSKGKGSVHVDEGCIQLISHLIGHEILAKLQTNNGEDYIGLRGEIESRKRAIKPDSNDSEWFAFKIPVELTSTFKRENTEFKSVHKRIGEKSSYGGRVKWERDRLYMEAKIVKELFKPPIQKLSNFIESLMRTDEMKGTKAVMLVGGFSESLIVRTELEERFAELVFIVPENPELSVMKGGVIIGFSPVVRPPSANEKVKELQRKMLEEEKKKSSVCSVS